MKLTKSFKAIDFFRKIPTDLTEATLYGAGISLMAAFTMTLLFGMELHAYLQTTTNTQIMVDQSSSSELLKINFNISFPSLSCEFLTVDVSDSLGTRRLNLSKTVRKFPISEDFLVLGTPVIDKVYPSVEWEPQDVVFPVGDVTDPLSHDDFKSVLKSYDIVVVNFYAPWCPWCQRLAPAWEAATSKIHQLYNEEDGRIRLAKVDCTQEMNLCRSHHIEGFPTIRVFRNGHDDIGIHDHESYTGDRTLVALISFSESLVISAGKPHYDLSNHPLTSRSPITRGCGMAGFVLVKKVPGTLMFLARSSGHSFDHSLMNMSHVVHAFMFGTWMYGKKYRTMARMHPGGIEKFWGDRMLKDQYFVSVNDHSTHEHYMQVIHNTFKPLDGGKDSEADVYEYTVHSHTYTNPHDIPMAKFSYQLSPMQVVVKEEKIAFYHFITTLCAIVGGVFTIAGILDSGVYTAVNLAKKIDLGKQG